MRSLLYFALLHLEVVPEHRKKHLSLVSVLQTVEVDLFQRHSLVGLNFLLFVMAFNVYSVVAVEEFVILLQIVNDLILTVDGEINSARAAHAE